MRQQTCKPFGGQNKNKQNGFGICYHFAIKREMRFSKSECFQGFACVLTTQLKGRTVLRICPIHPETTEDDIRHTIQRMYQYARALKKECVSNFS